MQAWLLWAVHRIALLAYTLHAWLQGKLARSCTPPAPAAGKKQPRHVLIRADNLDLGAPRRLEAFLEDCLGLAARHDLEHLTVIGHRRLVRSLVATGAAEVYENHRLVQASAGALKVNVCSEDQLGYFVRELSLIASADPEFRFTAPTLLSHMSSFPQVDLVISTLPRLGFSGCLPTQIGFAEIAYRARPAAA